MEHVAHRAVVQDYDLAQVGLYRAKVLDVCPVPVGAMLPVKPL